MSNITQGSKGWVQYGQQPEASGGLSECTTETTRKLPGFDTMLNPENSCTSNVDLNPKRIIAKPIRGRSRASRRTPITLLNANITNFRAVVQQFTGCHSAAAAAYKGPINLNFGEGNEENDFDTASSIPMLEFCKCYHHQTQAQEHDQQLHEEEQQQKQLYEEQEPEFMFGNMADKNIFLSDFAGSNSANGFSTDMDSYSAGIND